MYLDKAPIPKDNFLYAGWVCISVYRSYTSTMVWKIMFRGDPISSNTMRFELGKMELDKLRRRELRTTNIVAAI